MRISSRLVHPSRGFRLATLTVAASLCLQLGFSVATQADNAIPASSINESAPEVSQSATNVAAAVDAIILKELDESGTTAAEKSNDEDFLRRITFDLAGTAPSPNDVTFFGLDPDSNKRAVLIDRLLESDDFAQNWTGYWRDVIYSRATEARSKIGQSKFEEWMSQQIRENRPWNEITTELITATGDVRENGQTALLFAHAGQAPDIASETSRIFLGIQIQCANCHDHPTDEWKREQFHQLAAFFPRVVLRRVQDVEPRTWVIASFDRDAVKNNRRARLLENPEQFVKRFDANGDGTIVKAEVKKTPAARFFDRMLKQGDSNQDQALSVEEIKKLPKPKNRKRGKTEYFMADLSDPGSKGTRVDPEFFVDGTKISIGQKDVERRTTLAQLITSPNNPWFAKAFVNRIWAELLGAGFYMPVDDIGPSREPRYPQALELLASSFIATNYDVKWLFRTIANTDAYARRIRDIDESDSAPPFAAATATRLRADQVFSAMNKVLGAEEAAKPARKKGKYRGNASARGRFNELFGFDPSTPQEDITGTVPQALFLMNSPRLNGLIRGTRGTRLSQILSEHSDNTDAISELYLLVLSREPSSRDLKLCLNYLATVDNRSEAFEDIMWSLLNSSEFLSRR